MLLVDAYDEGVAASPYFAPWLASPDASWEVHTVRAMAHAPPSLAAHKPRAVVVTGSVCSVLDDAPWIHALRVWLTEAVLQGVPVLGVCWGHQLLASAVGIPVRRAAVPEVGFGEVVVDVADPVLAGLAPRFQTFQCHEDEVVADPGVVEVLAHSEACAVQAFRVRGYRAWGVQFHVEYPLEEVERLVRWRAERHPELGLDPDAILGAVPDLTPSAQALFTAFLQEAA